MNKEKISSQEIIDLVASKASVSKRAAEEFLKVMIASIEEALLAREVVKIKNFGTFKLLWNEPRKSVNVQTREEIILAGYYKVGFVPDTILKEQVNEPFAHLEPVGLDVKSIIDSQEENDEVLLDPLRIFTEQASEIKNLISEIQALSVNSKVTSSEVNVPENIIEIKREVVIKKVIEPIPQVNDDYFENIEEVYDDNETFSVTEIVVKEAEVKLILTENNESHSDLPVTPYLSNIKSLKKSRVWVWTLLLIILFVGSGSVLYFFYPPVNELSKKPVTYFQSSISKIPVKVSVSDFFSTIFRWFSPAEKQKPVAQTIVIPKDTNDFDSISQNHPIDSLQYFFDNPRVYNDFIASERIKPGNRLTIMSKKYYASKEFWVYIYEANKDRILNPDDIAIGTLIRIPKLDAKLIDLDNPRCLKKARELHDIYIK